MGAVFNFQFSLDIILKKFK